MLSFLFFANFSSLFFQCCQSLSFQKIFVLPNQPCSLQKQCVFIACRYPPLYRSSSQENVQHFSCHFYTILSLLALYLSKKAKKKSFLGDLLCTFLICLRQQPIKKKRMRSSYFILNAFSSVISTCETCKFVKFAKKETLQVV